MADFVSSLNTTPIVSSASSSGAAACADHDDDSEDACSICLEPFNSDDPPTVTKCRHEYHLQCILEWSQRSKECPICWQLLALKDPASQELLAAVERERKLRSKRNAHHIYEEREIHHGNFYADDSDFDERIIRHFSAAARRARYVNRRGRQRTSDIGASQVLHVPTADLSLPEAEVQYVNTTSPEESSSYEFPEGYSPTSNAVTTIHAQTPTSGIHAQTPSSVVQDALVVEPNSVGERDGCKYSDLLPESPQRPSSSEFLAFSESVRSKFSSASARYKESISKGTRGFKEKLLARNISVKELGRGVQREMNASISGVARMIERLDLASKRSGVSSPSCPGRTSNFCRKGKDMQESTITLPAFQNAEGEAAHGTSSDASPCVPTTNSGQVEVPLLQGGN